MSARRDALFFLALALVPSVAIAVLGGRAIRNERAAREREVTVSAAQTAEMIVRRIRDAVRDGAESLGAQPPAEGASAELLYERARRLAPGLSEPLVFSSDSGIVFPRSSAPRSGDPSCERRATEFLRAPTDALGVELAAECEEVRDASGRWLWPVLALDPTRSNAGAVSEERVLAWLTGHADSMSPEERALTLRDAEVAEPYLPGLSDKVQRVVEAEGRRGRGDSSVMQGVERSRVFLVAARSAATVPGTIERFAGDGQLGALVATGPDISGFVVNRDTLARDSSALAVEDARFEASVTLATEARDRSRLETRAKLVEGLEISVRLRDADAIARERKKTERMLVGLLTVGVGLALMLSYVLFRRMRETRRTSELRTSFVAGVSHELRTPLASIRMLSELLAEDRVPEDERAELLRALTGETKRLTTTLERFLAYAKSERGKLVASRTKGDLGVVLRDRVDAFRERSGCTVELGLDEDAKRSAAHLWFDRHQLEIVLDNLLENAKKYAPEGQPYTVDLRATSNSITVCVDDGGPGVPTSAEKRIFRAFERGDDRLSAAVSGTGLGLFLVRTIAEAHGGSVRVTRSSRGGARFELTLPRGER